MRKSKAFWLSIALLSGAILLAALLIRFRPQAERRAPEKVVPTVTVQEVIPAPERVKLFSDGTVRANVRAVIRAEVSGIVQEVSPAFEAGLRVEKGQILIRLDDSDLRNPLEESVFQRVQAEVELEKEKGRHQIARNDWAGNEKEASPLALREPQLKEAKARLKAAKEREERARRDLARATIRAPFTGKIVRRSVSPGDFLQRGGEIGEMYDPSSLEVRLPLLAQDLAFLQGVRNASVLVKSSLGEFQGEVLRKEAVVEEASRFAFVVAGNFTARPGSQGEGAELLPGMFVSAEISGREYDEVVVLPREALRVDGTVLVVQEDNTLLVRRVSVLKKYSQEVLLSQGLRAKERVVTSPLRAAVEGMLVQVAPQEDA